MMAAFLEFFPWLVGVAGALAALFFHQHAKTTKAEAAQEVAERNAAAAQSSADAAQERTNVENEIRALPADATEQRLRDDWTRP